LSDKITASNKIAGKVKFLRWNIPAEELYINMSSIRQICGHSLKAKAAIMQNTILKIE
jgi:hypothetical protein